METTQRYDDSFVHILVDLEAVKTFFLDLNVEDYASSHVHFHGFANTGFNDKKNLPSNVSDLMYVSVTRAAKSISQISNRNIIFKVGQLSALDPTARFYVVTPYNAGLALEQIMLQEKLAGVSFCSTEDLAHALKKEFAPKSTKAV